MKTYQGVLTFHSETGTEGGYWAFQDAKYMGLDAGQQYRCTRCGRVWDRDRDPQEPKPSFTYWHPEETKNGKNYAAGYRSSDTYQPDGNLGPDTNYTTAINETSRQCAEEGHPEWENMYPNGMWSYEGLHLLQTGDLLTVYDTDRTILFDGLITLPPEQDPYAPGAYAAGGYLTAHNQPPLGTDENWWFEQKQATLTTRK